MFANIKHSIIVFNDHLFDVCEDSSKCEKRLCMAGKIASSRQLLVLVPWPDVSSLLLPCLMDSVLLMP